jgi:hypothetical protein
MSPRAWLNTREFPLPWPGVSPHHQQIAATSRSNTRHDRIAVPVTKSDAGPARNAAIPAMSAASPPPAGVRFHPLAARHLRRARRQIGVDPARQHRVDRMLSFAHAVAIARVICTMPPLLDA